MTTIMLLFLFYVAATISSAEAFGDCIDAGTLVVRACAGKKLRHTTGRECSFSSIKTALGYSPVSFPSSHLFSHGDDSPVSNKGKKLNSTKLDQDQGAEKKEYEVKDEQLSQLKKDFNTKEGKQQVLFQWARRIPRPRLPPMPWGNRKGDPIMQPSVVHFSAEIDPMDIHNYFMTLALEQAQHAASKYNEVPIGAVVVQKIDGQNKCDTKEEKGVFFELLSKAHNKVETLRDATAHAEMLALRQTSRQQRNWRLYNTTLYTTLEPCPMCLASCQAFRVGHVVYGAPDLRLGAVESFIPLLSMGPPHPYHPRMNVTGGVMAEECAEIMKSFFVRRRAQKKGTANMSLNEVMGDRGRNLDEKSSELDAEDSTSQQTAAKLACVVEMRKEMKKTQQEKAKRDSAKIASGDLEYQNILDELATAKKNVMDAEKELVELEEIENLAKEHEQTKNTALLKQKESNVLELDARKTFRNFTPFKKRDKSKEASSKEKVATEIEAKKQENKMDPVTEEEANFSQMTSKQILEKHILDNTATEMKRIDDASLAKAEEDVLRIFSDLKQLKQVAGSDLTTNHTDADAAIVTPEPDVAFRSGNDRFAKVASPKLGKDQFSITGVEPTSVRKAMDDIAFPRRLSQQKDPTDNTEAVPNRSVTDRLSFWKGSSPGEGKAANTDRKKKRLADYQGAAKKKLTFLSEENNEGEGYVDSILKLDLNLDLGDNEIEEDEVLGL